MTVQALAGIKVLDVATLFAGPMAATLLGDHGAEVLKVEHPRGDPSRTHGASKDGIGLWWKMLGRNKKSLTLYLGSPEGQRLFRELAADADVIIENFRPGTLERWGLGYDVLAQDNPGLVLARVTGFGQFGPYSARPGFGTLAEAMSGFAALTGESAMSLSPALSAPMRSPMTQLAAVFASPDAFATASKTSSATRLALSPMA